MLGTHSTNTKTYKIMARLEQDYRLLWFSCHCQVGCLPPALASGTLCPREFAEMRQRDVRGYVRGAAPPAWLHQDAPPGEASRDVRRPTCT